MKSFVKNTSSLSPNVASLCIGILLFFFASTSYAVIDESLEPSLYWSTSYRYSPSKQPVLAESSENSIDTSYQAFSIDGGTYVEEVNTDKTSGGWSWGVAYGFTNNNKSWEDVTNPNRVLVESSEINGKDYSAHIGKQLGDWQYSVSVFRSLNKSTSQFTRLLPNQRQNYLNVNLAQTFDYQETAILNSLSYGHYLQPNLQNWWINITLSVGFHDSKSIQKSKLENVLLVDNVITRLYVDSIPSLKPGVLRNDNLTEKNKFWSQELSISLDYELEVAEKMLSISPWLTYQNYSAPEGSLAYARNIRGNRPISRTVTLDDNNEFASSTNGWFIGADLNVSLSDDAALSIGVSKAQQVDYSWSFGFQYWF